MSAALAPVIVGAGPAGVRAAQTLVAHGLRPVLIDEAARCGGQIYRQPPAQFARHARDVYGPDAAAAQALHQAMDGVAGNLDYRPNTLVWNIEGRRLDLLQGGAETGSVEHDGLIIAAGATDRVLPFPGWTLPGVFTLGAAQIALKFQGCAIGPRVVLAGTGPLLYLVAWQYAKAGAAVAAVLDEATTGNQIAALPSLLREPALLARGLRFRAALMARGIPVRLGARLRRAVGIERVEALEWSDRENAAAPTQRVECDAVAFGYHLRPETQLADLADCRFEFDPLQRAWLPHCDAAGRTSVAGVYLAGDGAGIRGAQAAELAGERAALALLADRGAAVDAARGAVLERKLAAKNAWRAGLERAFPFPADWAAQVPDDLEICRCEHVTAGELRRTARDCEVRDLNRLKALARVGMGRCQARMCGAAAAEILAHAAGTAVSEVGRVRGQAPVKPLPFAAVDSVGEAQR